MKTILKFICGLLAFIFALPTVKTSLLVNSLTLNKYVLIDTDFSDWETNGENLLRAGTNASISYEYDRVLGKKVISAKLPKGLNGSNSIYFPETITKGKEYKVFIGYRITSWSCISYNGSSVFDGGKPLDSQSWNSVTYTFTPTVDNAYFRIGTNQDNYTIYISELKISETVQVNVGTGENGTASVSATSAGVGEKVTFSASPNSGYKFVCWKDSDGKVVSRNATYEHTVTGEITLIPQFREDSNVLEYYFEDFEDGELCEGGYTTSDTFMISATPDNSSKYCLKHTATSESKYYYIKTPTLDKENTYKVSFKGYGNGADSWVRFNVHDSTSAYISKTGCFIPANKWTEFTFDITPEADGWYVGFLMNVEAYIDDFKIVNTAFEDEIPTDTPEEEEPEIIYDVGDANGDNIINIKDLIRLKKNISTDKAFKSYEDVNYDNSLDSLDLILLSKFLLGIVDYFPVGGVTPYAVTLSMYDSDSYGITWNTNGRPLRPMVEICQGDTFNKESCREIPAIYTEESSYNKTDEKEISYHVMKVNLSELKVGETYTYRCVDKTFGSFSDEFTFTVNNREKESFKFIHISDSQTIASSYLDPIGDGKGSGWALANTFNGVEKSAGNYDFIIHTGDIVEWSKYESYWRYMIDINGKYFASVPIMPLSGNHEATYRNGKNEIFKHFNIALTQQDTSKGIYYSFDYGNTKFIMLDTNDLSSKKIKDDQYNWLVNTLKNNKSKWTVVSMHNPIYSVGKWGSNSSQNAISLSLREQLSDLFAEYGVDIVLQGHDHTYSKTYPIGTGGTIQTELEYKNISGINYCTNADGVVYVMNGAAGNQSRSYVDGDKSFYELYGNSSPYSWAEIEVASDKLTVKVYNYNITTDQAVLWNSYGIKK